MILYHIIIIIIQADCIMSFYTIYIIVIIIRTDFIICAFISYHNYHNTDRLYHLLLYHTIIIMLQTDFFRCASISYHNYHDTPIEGAPYS